MKKILICALSLMIMGGCSDKSQESFNDVKDASTAIEQGWVPSDLPENATNILQAHDIDLNLVNGMFSIPPEDIEDFVSILEHTDVDALLAREYVPANFWNDTKIKKAVDNSDLIPGEKGDFIYAVSISGDVYYWGK